MDIVNYYGCYDYNKEWYLIEMLLNISASDIKWEKIFIREKKVKKDDWQVPYMEQYLNDDGTEKICETYEKPEENIKPCRIAFFIYKVPSDIISTPYGDFELSNATKVPERLKNLIEFE